MYLKWQSRPRKRIGSPLLTAVLVESHRVGGKPRQRTVAYLAGIRDVRIGSRHHRPRNEEAGGSPPMDVPSLETGPVRSPR